MTDNTKNIPANIRRVCLCLWEWLYQYHYALGVRTIRLFRGSKRRVGRATRPLRKGLRYLWIRRIVLPIHRFFHRQKILASRMKPAFKQLGEAAKKNVFSIFPCFWHLCRSAVKNYREQLNALGRLLGPVAAVVVLSVTLKAWNSTDFCLVVTYQGKEIGIVESVSVYDRGAALARGRVNNTNGEFEVDAVPTFTMKVRRGKSTLTETEICDAILRQSGDAIAEVNGLYVDGNFLGAMEDSADIAVVLSNLMADYDATNPNQRAEFVQTVEIVEGLYPISAIAADTDSLTRVAQSHLQIQIIETKVVEESIPFKTSTVYREDKLPTYSKTTVKGVNGSKDVTYEYVYLNGEVIAVQRVSEVVTKEAVQEVHEVGTKKVYASDGSVVVQGDGIATGKWTWPVPVCHNIYQGYHSGHKAIDISSGPIPVQGKPCLAADGGTVVYAGWYYDYGYYVKIDHGNGLVTTYAHLDSVSVIAGQKVSNGQQIGRVGNTGWSEGPHLHLELYDNGIRVNPVLYGIEP